MIHFPGLLSLHVSFAIFTGPLFFLFIQSIFKEECLDFRESAVWRSLTRPFLIRQFVGTNELAILS
ncbi:hypothetical protein DLM78_02845 [Leptospira stimsonii]|uniref:Uncharacterized protein n=1 Tax=Leptospira stimsonii TaxID=2202203 RepID=A0A8B3CTB4_9LEPT|nr:hypothetical protein DLM78_02845 [Leptospira stimsonii]